MAKWSNEKMADLTRKLADTAIEQNKLYQAILRDAKEAEAYAEELKAKLAKAVEALESVISCSNDVWIVQDAETTLAELKGEDRG